MSFETGTATSYTDLLDKLNAFLAKGHALPPVYTGLGTGLITLLMGTSSSVQETIAITFTSATDFGVVGSVTGSMGTGTVGSAFGHARCTFTVVAGGTAWANGDTITVVMTPAWATLRSVAGSEYIWQAPGNSNQDQIIVGALVFTNPSGNYYNWRLLGATGFNAGQVFASQPGSLTRPVLPLWSGSIPYWFIADGKCVKIIAKITTQFEHAYLGFPDAYASPGEWAYPLIVGGSMSWYTEPAAASADWRYSYVGNAHHAYWRPINLAIRPVADNFNYSQFRMRRPDGTWIGFTTYAWNTREFTVYPYTGGLANLQACLDGSVLLFPVWFCDDIPNTYGELSGVKAISGIGRGSEDTVTIGRDTYLVAQDCSYTSADCYAAFLLA